MADNIELLEIAKKQRKENDKILLKSLMNSEAEAVKKSYDDLTNLYAEFQNNISYWEKGMLKDMENIFDPKMKVFQELENKLKEFNLEFKEICKV